MWQPDWIARWALYQPDKIALREDETGRELSYGELDRQANRLAHRLRDQYRLAKGDRVAVLSEFSLEYVVLFVAAQKTGIVLVPLNYRLAAPELNFALQDTRPELLLWCAPFDDTIRRTEAFAQVPHRLTMEELEGWLTAEAEPQPPVAAIDLQEDDPVFILYTSGTTGYPKGALYTHGMLFWNSVNTAISLGITDRSRTIVCMPPFHTGGWNVLLTPFLHHGAYCCLVRKFSADRILQLLQSERPSIFMGVPTMLKMLRDEPAFAGADLSSLDYLIVGGEAMPIPLIEAWHEKGVFIRQGYGMTEVGPNLTSLHQDDAIRKKGSIGRPNFYVHTRIVNGQGQECSPGEPGELLLRGPMVFPGYWRRDEASARALAGGWFHTGDMVRQDEEGYLYVVDRIKNMFISGGENVYPAEVERILADHPDLAEVAVVGVPDEKWGEVGRAFLVARNGRTPAPEELTGFCRERMARFKVPRHWTFLPELPKNDTGKIDRRQLSAR